MCLALQRPQREPSGKLIRSIGGTLGGPGSAKVCQGANFEGNPLHILTISFFALNAFWKASRGSLERVWGQRRVPREGQESFSSSLWGPKGGPRVKRHHWPNPSRTKPDQAGRWQGPWGPWGRTKGEDFTKNNPWTGSSTPWAVGPANC